MICYMPFADIEQHTMELLFNAMGTITVFSPAPALVPDHQQTWSDQGQLEIRHPAGIDEQQLLSAIEGFKAWSDLHQNNISDLAGFFRTQQGRYPLVEDTHPTQLGDQIRHYGEPASPDAVDPLFKAALFLSMAQELDRHHQTMHSDMDAVDAMERQMFKKLIGVDREEAAGTPLAGVFGSPTKDRNSEIFMIPQRMEAWARIVLSRRPLPLLYLTTSSAAFEHALDLFDRTVEVPVRTPAESRAEAPVTPSRFRETISTLAHQTELPMPDLEVAVHAEGSGNDPQVALFALQNVHPHDFLEAMITARIHRDMFASHQSDGDGPRHTFIGLVKAA